MTAKLIMKSIDSVPLGEEVLLYWKNKNHHEKGRIEITGNGDLYNVLSLDGDMIDEPTHWTECPELIFT